MLFTEKRKSLRYHDRDSEALAITQETVTLVTEMLRTAQKI